MGFHPFGQLGVVRAAVNDRLCGGKERVRGGKRVKGRVPLTGDGRGRGGPSPSETSASADAKQHASFENPPDSRNSSRNSKRAGRTRTIIQMQRSRPYLHHHPAAKEPLNCNKKAPPAKGSMVGLIPWGSRWGSFGLLLCGGWKVGDGLLWGRLAFRRNLRLRERRVRIGRPAGRGLRRPGTPRPWTP